MTCIKNPESLRTKRMFFFFLQEPWSICTCADEEHVVRSLVQAVDPIHRQPREVDTLGEQQGASQSFVVHQRVFLGEVERGVRQMERVVVAVLPVIVGNTLQHRQRTERRGRERMWAKPRRRSMKRRKVLRCSWHRLAWLLGYENTALSPSLLPLLQLSFTDFHLRLPSHPFLCFPSSRTGSLHSWLFVLCQLKLFSISLAKVPSLFHGISTSPSHPHYPPSAHSSLSLL